MICCRDDYFKTKKGKEKAQRKEEANKEKKK